MRRDGVELEVAALQTKTGVGPFLCCQCVMSGRLCAEGADPFQPALSTVCSCHHSTVCPTLITPGQDLWALGMRLFTYSEG